MKNKSLYIRLTSEDYNHLKKICEELKCTKTKYITDLIRRGEYTKIEYTGFNEFQKQFGAIGNNINQIARALNIIKNSNQMNDEQYEEILNRFDQVKAEYLKYQQENINLLKKMYRFKEKKKRFAHLDLTDEEKS